MVTEIENETHGDVDTEEVYETLQNVVADFDDQSTSMHTLDDPVQPLPTIADVIIEQNWGSHEMKLLYDGLST